VSAIVQDRPHYLVKNPPQSYSTRSASTSGSVRHCSRLSALSRKESAAIVPGPQVPGPQVRQEVSAFVQDCPLYLVKNLQLDQVRKYVRKCPPFVTIISCRIQKKSPPLSMLVHQESDIVHASPSRVRHCSCLSTKSPPLFMLVHQESAIVHACPSRVRHCS
jgi:hypothetical protein